MPMPTDGVWPPPEHAPAYEGYRDWSAWYGGNPDQLREVYQGRGALGQRVPPSQRTYPGQYSGGVVGRFSRWLWGTPTSTSSRDTRVHIPLPADLSATVANLLFSEPPKLSAADTAVTTRLERLVEDGLNRTLLHAAEANSFLGDVYLRPVVDQEVMPGRAFLHAVHADGAIPTIRWERLVEVTFWSELYRDGQTVVRLLEHHDVVRDAAGVGTGRITYAVHEGGPDALGRRVDLGAFPSTRHLRDAVDGDGSQPTGLDRLDVVRVPNAGPQRLWRNSACLKYLGRSDYDGNESVFDQIDEVWTSWMRDIRLAKGRITVPEQFLQANGPGLGASWDPDREVYSTISALDMASGAGITVSQFAIRHAEHKATADALVEVALRHAGLSSQTMGEEGGDPVTATEIQARERQSFTTRGNRIQAWRPALAEAVELLLAVERANFSGAPDPVRPDVEFGDSVSEAPEAVARTLQLLYAAESVSVQTRVEMLHPDWDDRQVAEEVARIKGDTGVTVEDPGTFTGLAPDEADPEDAEPTGEE